MPPQPLVFRWRRAGGDLPLVAARLSDSVPTLEGVLQQSLDSNEIRRDVKALGAYLVSGRQDIGDHDRHGSRRMGGR